MLANKTIVVCGVANAKSIAWNMAKKLQSEKASVVITYQKEEWKGKIQSMIDKNAADSSLPEMKSICCDLTKTSDLESLHNYLSTNYQQINGLIHSVAFAPSTALHTSITNISKEDFNTTMTISCYSFLSLVGALTPVLSSNASIAALSFIGSQRYFANYGIMSVAKAALESSALQLAGNLGPQHIRVNVLRAAPLNTLASRGLTDFHGMSSLYEQKKLMTQENVMDDVCKTGAWLMSDYSSGVTGEVINVDGGFTKRGI